MAALLPALLLPGLAAFLAFVVLRDSPAGVWVFGAAKIFLLAWPAFWIFGVERRSWREFLAPPRGMGRGLAVGFFFAFLVWLGWVLGLSALLAEHRAEIEAALGRWGSRRNYWVWAAFMSLAHAAVEEWYWRGFVFTRLRREINSGAAVVLSSAFFGLHHGVLYAATLDALTGAFLALAVALAGAAWCLLYREEESLWAPWISHVIADLAIFAVGSHFLSV